MRIKDLNNITSKEKYYDNSMANNEWINEDTHPDTIVLPNWSYIYMCIYKRMSAYNKTTNELFDEVS
jgi:hypothetical protein